MSKSTQLEPEFYAPFLSEAAKARQPSAIRSLFPLEKTPGLISLLAGKPNPETFPFSAISVTLKPLVPGDQPVTLSISSPEDLSEALQYTATAGLPRLLSFLDELQYEVHARRRGSEGDDQWRISVGNGSQDLLTKACSALINPGDYVLIESPVYTGAIPGFQAEKSQFVEVNVDDQGMSSSHLKEILESWPSNKPHPKIVYTVPTGNNPSGASAGKQRKIEILELARQHNLIILEDDPYYFLTFDTSERVPSYFALEASIGGERGRVLRFDSMSKVLSSGLRIGFATGPTALLNAMDLHTSHANLQPNSTAQAITQALFEHWGVEGLLKHVQKVADFYRGKRDAFEAAAKKHLHDVASWVTPQAGMFLWLKLDCADSLPLIRDKAVANGVLALPGAPFYPTARATPYCRASFSLATAEEADEAFRRLRQTILDSRLEHAGGGQADGVKENGTA